MFIIDIKIKLYTGTTNEGTCCMLNESLSPWDNVLSAWSHRYTACSMCKVGKCNRDFSRERGIM